jgi:hypothetical protein
MPKLSTDPRYLAAMKAQGGVFDEELRAFRSRVSMRLVGLVGVAIEEMGSTFNERKLRRALASYDTIFIEESLGYVRRVLIRAGEIELAKRVAEAYDTIGLADLPPEFAAAYDELQRAGLLLSPDGGPPEPSASRLAEVN